MRKYGWAGLALVIVAAVAGGTAHVEAQQDGPQPSPAATVTQVVGVNPITITYHSPGVKGRTVWGELVPYGEVWRAGANDKTTIEFTEDVLIEGQPVPAGVYGFQIVPTEDTWELVFSDNPAGRPNARDPENDVAVVKVAPKEAPFRERLAYGFDNMTDNSATIFLHWETLKGEFTVTLAGG